MVLDYKMWPNYLLCTIELKHNDIGKSKVVSRAQIYHVSVNQKKAVILVSDKVDSRTKKITRVREGHYTVTKGWIHQEDTAILNVASQNHSCKIFEVKTEKTEKKSIIIVGDFYISLSTT